MEKNKVVYSFRVVLLDIVVLLAVWLKMGYKTKPIHSLNKIYLVLRMDKALPSYSISNQAWL